MTNGSYFIESIMDNKEYVLTEGAYVSYWHEGRNYTLVKYVCDYGITLEIYKVIKNKNGPRCTVSSVYGAGDTVFFTWASCPNLKFEKSPDDEQVSYASWT